MDGTRIRDPGPDRVLTNLNYHSWHLALAFRMGLAPAQPPVPSPHAIDIPKWFTESFLDVKEDIRDAARDTQVAGQRRNSRENWANDNGESAII